MENNWIARQPFFLLKNQPRVVSYYCLKTDRNYINKNPIDRKEVYATIHGGITGVRDQTAKLQVVTASN